MKLVKIGNKWINLERVIEARNYAEYKKIELQMCSDYSVVVEGAEAKALAQLLDNMSTLVKVQEDNNG